MRLSRRAESSSFRATKIHKDKRKSFEKNETFRSEKRTTKASLSITFPPIAPSKEKSTRLNFCLLLFDKILRRITKLTFSSLTQRSRSDKSIRVVSSRYPSKRRNWKQSASTLFRFLFRRCKLAGSSSRERFAFKFGVEQAGRKDRNKRWKRMPFRKLSLTLR